MAPKSSKTKASANAGASSSSSSPPAHVIYWFRTDLRLTDSPALREALSLPNIASFTPVWCWDPNYIYGHRVGLNRWSFLLESMQSVSDELTKINPNQKLHVVRGRPHEVLPLLWEQWETTHLVYEKDSNGYAKDRDREIKALAREKGVEVLEIHGRHLFDPDEVGKANNGKPTMTLGQWQGVTKKMGDVEKPVAIPDSLPGPASDKLDSKGWKFVKPDTDLNSHIRTADKDTCYQNLTGPKSDFAVPTMAEMGFGKATTSIRGGTSEAHRRLKLFLSEPEKVAKFSKPHTAPTSIEPSTTLLSPFLKFGCLGVRELWWGCKDVVAKYKGEKTKEPENMFGQLEFRDMYACAEAACPDFQRIRGNPVCRYIDWDLSSSYDSSGNEIRPRPKGDEEAEKRLQAWRDGQTGFPWIDATMRQLKHEGWIHHLARHSTACFLTRGQCYISWERGMEVYDEWLIDWDPASNPGNWMWLSCSAFFSQYYRVYGLVSWPQKTDKTGALVRKYCPELKNFPDKYIYAPHTAPDDVQRKAGCIIGTDYPYPILDEHAEKDRCIARLKNAYSLGYHGSDADVLDGTAEHKLKELHEESGAGVVKSEKEKKAEAGERKRKKSGDMSLDGFVKRGEAHSSPETKKRSSGTGKGKQGDDEIEEEEEQEEGVVTGKNKKVKKETVQGEA